MYRDFLVALSTFLNYLKTQKILLCMPDTAVGSQIIKFIDNPFLIVGNKCTKPKGRSDRTCLSPKIFRIKS